jgi:hypothetical protein
LGRYDIGQEGFFASQTLRLQNLSQQEKTITALITKAVKKPNLSLYHTEN